MQRKRKYPFAGAHGNGPGDIESCLREIIAQINPTALKTLLPLVFVHQLYQEGRSRTWVDQQIGMLKTEGKVTAIKLRVENTDMSVAVAFTSDLSTHLKSCSTSRIVKQFADDILPHIRDLHVDKNVLKNRFKLPESAIKELVHESVLVIQDVGRYCLSFSGAGEFVKTYATGRKNLIRTIRRAKHSELLEAELVKRSIPKTAVLGIKYHILDLIGSEDAKCIKTTSGNALRITSD